MSWPQDIQSATPAKYLFKLISATETILCDPEPLEWASGELTIKRDLDAGGVFSSFQLDSLTFVGNGAEMLRKLFEAYELNASCTLVIGWWKGLIRDYVEFPVRFDINFAFYEVVNVGTAAFGIKIKAINSSTQTKLDNRQDVDVDLMKLTSIGGVKFTDYSQLKKGLYYAATNVSYKAELNGAKGNFGLNHLYHKVSYSSFPFDVKTNDFTDEIKSTGFINNTIYTANVPSFFKEAKFDHDLDIHYDIAIKVTNRYVGSFPWRVQILETLSNGDINTLYDIAGFGGTVMTYGISGDISVHIAKGNDLKFVIRSEGIDSSYMAFLVYNDITVTEQVANAPATLTEGFPLYEALERTCQHMLDTQYPIYSEFFGRVDVAYDPFGNKYVSENQFRFAHIQSGMNQRGISLDNPDSPLALNFKKLFAAIKSLYNVGYSFEVVSGTVRVRIEEYAHFFQSLEALNISDRLSRYDIQSQVMPELVPVDIKSGFDSFEYLTINGRAEPNTTNQRTSIMNTATKFEAISPLRGDTKGISVNLSNPVDNSLGSTDTKSDSAIFIVKTQRDSEHQWKPEKGENISIVGDTSLFKNDLLNRYFTPTRMLLRHGNRLKAGMTKFLDGVLTFQTSDKNCSLITSDDGGVTALAENGDIPVSSLSDPIYKPMKHTVNCVFTFSDLEAIQANPFGYITFSDTVKGYLLSLKKKNNEDKAEIIIIEKYEP